MMHLFKSRHLRVASNGDLSDESSVLAKDIVAVRERLDGIAEKKEGPRKVARMKAKMKKG
jgi:hypothetical protein